MSTDDLPQPPGPQPGAGGAPATGGPVPPRSGDGFFDSIRRLGVTRSDDRWVGGVAGGVAERFGLDPLLVRGLLILSFFLTGAGIVIYAIAWALLPERDGRIHLQQAFRGDFDVALLGAVVALIVGFAWGDGFWSWGGGRFFDWVAGILWVAVWVAIVWLIVKLIRDRKPRSGGPNVPPAPPYPATPYPATPYASTPAPGTAAPAPSGTAGGGTSDTGMPYGAGGPSGAVPTDSFAPAPPAPYLAAPTLPQPPAPAATGSWAAAPAPAAPLAAPAPLAPPAPPRPPRPVRRGPGAGAVGIVLGLVLLAGALLLVADRTNNLGLPLGPTWLGISIVVLGVGLVVTGLRGRRGGMLTFFAILALIAGVITWPFAGTRGSWDFWDAGPQESGSATVVSDGTVTPRSIEEAEDGVNVRFGSAVVDLTELDLGSVTPGDPVVVPISMAAGSTQVLIPADQAVQADVQVIAGNATWRADGQDNSVNTYTNGPARFTTDEVHTAGGARLVLDVDVRAGDLTIEESR
ncbi:PspC domain-containing protein [Isoptericola sp. NPDC057559]|uniref:PspC domain-containing protein n=1 Tax=Isoptericola sp. NPDC057559 TaxID=3346168 RepID=UPI00368CA364